jgi:hypothetical protein
MTVAPGYTDRRKYSLLLALLALVLAALAERYIQFHGLSIREILLVILAVLAVAVLQSGERGVRIGFVVWVCTLGVGYRTIPITPELRLHPSEVILWALLGLLWLRRVMLRRSEAGWWLPGWLWVFMPFWCWAWWPGLQVGEPWDQMLSECRDFVLFVPLFAVAQTVLARQGSWRPILAAFYVTGAWIAVTGLLEYLFPSVAALLPQQQGEISPVFTTGEGFLRAKYTFWGSPVATFVCVLTLPLGLQMWQWWPAAGSRALTLGLAALHLGGIYIGGYRSMWLVVLCQAVIVLMVRQGPLLGTLCLLPLIAAHRLMPASTQERALTLVVALEGHPVDSSATKRWARALEALDTALQQPFGHGWATAGWVHSDFIQLAANLGLMAALLFAGAYAVTTLRLWGRFRALAPSHEFRHVGLVLGLSFVGVGTMLAIEGIEVLPQLALPVWFIWVMVEIWLRQTSRARRVAHALPSDFRPAAGV